MAAVAIFYIRDTKSAGQLYLICHAMICYFVVLPDANFFSVRILMGK